MSTTVMSPRGRLHVTDRPGAGPAIVLMHGFPDDARIYDRLVPLLAPRRVVTFDFFGYGRSGRPAVAADGAGGEVGGPQQDLLAVIESLGLERPTVVGHDASGPVAVDVALDARGRVGHLVLLNSYYGRAPGLRFPEMIRLFADPDLVPLADAMAADENQRLWLLQHTGRQFGYTQLNPDGIAGSVIPQFYGDDEIPDALAAIRAWTGTLFADVELQEHRIASGEVGTLDIPVTVVFGEDDPYLGAELARYLATKVLPHARLHLVADASHWPQWDRPDAVAEPILRGADR